MGQLRQLTKFSSGPTAGSFQDKNGKEFEFTLDMQLTPHPDKKGYVLAKPSVVLTEKKSDKKSDKKVEKQDPFRIVFVIDTSASMFNQLEPELEFQVVDSTVDLTTLAPRRGICYVQKTPKGGLRYYYKKEVTKPDPENKSKVDGCDRLILSPPEHIRGEIPDWQVPSFLKPYLKKSISKKPLSLSNGEKAKMRQALDITGKAFIMHMDYLQYALEDFIESLPDPENYRFSVISFSEGAKVLATNEGAKGAITAIKALPGGTETDLSAGLMAITPEMISGDSKKGVTSEHESNSLIVLLSDGKSTKNEGSIKKTLKTLLKRFGGYLSKLFVQGIKESSSEELSTLAVATDNRYFYVSDSKDLSHSLAENLTAQIGKRVQARMKIAFGNQKAMSMQHSIQLRGGGIILGQPWSRVLELETQTDAQNGVSYQLEYDIGGQVIRRKQAFKKIETNYPVLYEYILGKINYILHCPKTVYSKSKKLEELKKLEAILEKNKVDTFLTEWAHANTSLKDAKKFINEDNDAGQAKLGSEISGTGMARQALSEHANQQGVTFEDDVLVGYGPFNECPYYRMLSRHTDFASPSLGIEGRSGHNTRYQTLISVGATLNAEIREVIGVHHSSLSKFRNLSVIKEKKEIPLLLQSIARHTICTFSNKNLEEVLPSMEYKSSMGLKIYALDSFVEKKTGLCRHHAFYNACLIGQAVNKHKLGGSVHLYRNVAWNLKRHAWVIYKDRNGHIFLIDSTLPGSKQVYNLSNKEDRKAALDIYAEEGLEGVLENVFKDFNLPKHPKRKVTVSPELLRTLSKRSVFHDMEMICPMSKEIMRDPVFMITKKDRMIKYFERDFITQWVKDRKDAGLAIVHPITGEKFLSPEICDAPDKFEKIWNVLVNITAKTMTEESMERGGKFERHDPKALAAWADKVTSPIIPTEGSVIMFTDNEEAEEAEVEEAEVFEPMKKIALPQKIDNLAKKVEASWLNSFATQYKASPASFGRHKGLTNPSNITEVLPHALQTTRFGNKNRTRILLENIKEEKEFGWLTEFNKKYNEDYGTTCWSRLFKRSQLTNRNALTVLLHAFDKDNQIKEKGDKSEDPKERDINRTRRILEEMEVLDKDGNYIYDASKKLEL